MRNLLWSLILIAAGCANKPEPVPFTQVEIKTVFSDSTSIRAIEFLDGRTLAFAGSEGIYGTVDIATGTIRTATMGFLGEKPEFRAVAHTKTDFFMLSAGNPALLYKTSDNGSMDLVYLEEGDTVFYDALKFWNDKEGIAMGDGENGCPAILITRDGGHTWSKLSCGLLPKLEGAVGAYAASNTNIEIKGDKTWIMTSKEQMLYSPDRGRTWNIVETPIEINETYHGIYSIDFYDETIGFGIGGDFSQIERNTSNKIRTEDGGQTWSLVAEGMDPGYKSCVQFVPGSAGKGMVAIGLTGIDHSNDGGESWERLSEEGFYTLRFLNDSVAFAAGRNRISQLKFK